MITRNLLTRSYKLLLTLLVLLMSTNAFAQRLTATGKVTDAAGLEVIGASVLEKGTANGVVTNLDGSFPECRTECHTGNILHRLQNDRGKSNHQHEYHIAGR